MLLFMVNTNKNKNKACLCQQTRKTGLILVYCVCFFLPLCPSCNGHMVLATTFLYINHHLMCDVVCVSCWLHSLSQNYFPGTQFGLVGPWSSGKLYIPFRSTLKQNLNRWPDDGLLVADEHASHYTTTSDCIGQQLLLHVEWKSFRVFFKEHHYFH